jgi:hypothetical protein
MHCMYSYVHLLYIFICICVYHDAFIYMYFSYTYVYISISLYIGNSKAAKEQRRLCDTLYYEYTLFHSSLVCSHLNMYILIFVFMNLCGCIYVYIYVYINRYIFMDYGYIILWIHFITSLIGTTFVCVCIELEFFFICMNSYIYRVISYIVQKYLI